VNDPQITQITQIFSWVRLSDQAKENVTQNQTPVGSLAVTSLGRNLCNLWISYPLCYLCLCGEISPLIGFAEEDAAGARGAGEDAFPWRLVFEGGIGWDAADCDLQVFFDLRLDRGVTGPMGKREAAVDLGTLTVLGSKEVVEIGFGIDSDRVLVTELFGTLIQAGLDLR